MKFSVTKKSFFDALKHAVAASSNSRNFAVLQNVLLDVHSNGVVYITGTDLTVEVVSQASCEVEQPGCVAVPAGKLRDIFSSIEDDESPTQLTLKDEHVEVRQGRSRFKLRHMSADKFPNVEIDRFTLARSVPSVELADLFRRIGPAMAKGDVRYYLNGMYLAFEQSHLRAVGTDGHRLNIDDIPAGSVDKGSYSIPGALIQGELAQSDGSAVIPREAIAGMQKLLLGDPGADAVVALSSSHFQLRVGGSVYTTKLIEGRYPDYNRVIPESQPSPVVADRETLRHALERARILSHENLRIVRLELAQDSITVSGSNSEAENAVESFGVAYPGEDIEIGFNVDYLLDALKTVESDEVELHVRDASSSILVRARDSDDQARYVVMPVRL